MRIFMPIILTAIFVLYMLHLAFVKKQFKSRLKTEILPGVFFIMVWGIFYVALSE